MYDYNIEPMGYVPLFEEHEHGILVIVDVQEPFEKWWIKNGKECLPERINDYCAMFDGTYQIWDDHRAKKPTWEFYKQIMALKKHYGVDNPTGDIKDYTKVFRPEDVEEAMSLAEPKSIATPKLFRTIDGNYIIRVIGGTHKWFFVSTDLYTAMANITSPIVLVGGAEGECLKDVETLLDILGKKYRTEHRYCYNAADEDVGFGDDDEEDSQEEPEASSEEEEEETPTDPIPLDKAKP